MTIAWSNNAVSWPVFAVLSRDIKKSGLLFYDFEKRRMIDDFSASRYVNSVSSYGEGSGKFLYTADEGFGRYAVYYYDYYSKEKRKLFEYENVLNAPFRISNSFCALSAKSKTQKQRYNYDVVCNGEIAISDIFQVYSYYNHNGDSAIFVDGVGTNTNAYNIYKENETFEHRTYKIPFFSNIFTITSGELGLVLIDRGNHEIREYTIRNDSITSIGDYDFSGSTCDGIERYKKIILINGDRAIGARINDSEDGIEFFVCDLNESNNSYQASMKID